MNNVLDKSSPITSLVMPQPNSMPTGLQITHDVRLRQAQAETMARFHLAMMLPRDMMDVSSKLLACCEDPDFAKAAVYRKPGTPPTEGLSIRFAERAVQYLRNISVDCSPEMEDDFSVHYRYTVTDMESNVPTSETFKINKTVERRGYKDGDTVLGQRTNSTGDIVYLLPATEDQMTAKVNAQKSKVKRNLVLALIPAEIRSQCLARCKSVANDKDKTNPAEATKTIVSSFLSIGIDVPDLKEYLGHSPSSLVVKELEDLRGIYVMIRDGDLTWSDVMEAKRETDSEKGSKAAFVAQKQKERAANKAKKGTAAAAPKPPAEEKEKDKDKPKPARAARAAAETTEEPAAAAPRARASRRGGDEEETESPPASESTDSNPPA